jgi:Phosphotransferase enzyme family
MDRDAAVTADITRLLAREGMVLDPLDLDPCGGSGNNRVFVVRSGTEAFVAKSYFVHPDDKRDRLRAETSFVRYATQIGLYCVPRLIAVDTEKNLALFEFVAGRRLDAVEVTLEHVIRAGEFIAALNAPQSREHAETLRSASEACFSRDEHLATIERRVERLDTIAQDPAADAGARRVVADITSKWRILRARIAGRPLPGGEPIDRAARVVSPSDFGFHNVLQRPSGELCFLDFEYAGWDDPAKTIGDFFAQPAVPVSIAHFDQFAALVTRHVPEPAALIERARALLPLVQLKWCCIMLNDFLPVSRERRRFADPGRDETAAQLRQLTNAANALARISI